MYRAIFMTALAFSASVGPAVSSEPRPMSVADMFEFARVSDPQISPDGKTVAYVVSTVDLAANSTSSCLWLADCHGNTTPRQLTRTTKKDSHPRWSPDGKWILFQSNRSGSLQIWAIPLSGGEAVQLTTIATDASSAIWSPDGRAFAFVSAVYPEFSTMSYAESNRLNEEKLKIVRDRKVKARVATRLFFRHWDSYVEDKRQHLFVATFDSALATAGEPRDVTPGDRDAYPTSMTFSAGDDFCFSPDGSHLIFTAVPAENEAWNTDHDLCRVPVSGGTTTWEKLGDNPAAEGNPVFSPDGDRLAFHSQSRPGCESDKWDVFVVHCDRQGKWKSAPVKLTAGLDRSADTIYWSRSDSGRQEVSFLCQERGKVIRYAVSLDGNQPPARHEESTSIDAISFSTNGGEYVILGSALNQPPEVFCRGKMISKVNDALRAEIAWGTAESVDVPGADGVPMQMWIVKPPGFREDQRWPLGFLVHGGPQGAWMDAWSNRWNPQCWAAQGYVIALPNPRGSTGFGQEYCDQISGDWGGRCYEDLMKGMDYLESLPYIDKSRTFAAGASFGGYMMNWFQGHTDRFRTLIAHCGVYNFDSMYATTEELWFDEYEHGGPPWGEHRDSYERHSPHRFAANFRTPMLVIHNDLDFRVPVSEGLQVFTTLQRLGVPSRFVNFPDEGHWVLAPANSEYWHQEVFDWLKQHCPPNP